MSGHVFWMKPRWADMDAYGHVNNVTWLEYLQEARVDMLSTHARWHQEDGLLQGVLVVRAEIDYKRPMVFRPEPYPIRLWVSQLRRVTFAIDYEIADRSPDPDGEATVYGRARTLLAPVDPGTGAPRRLTEAEHTALQPFVH